MVCFETKTWSEHLRMTVWRWLVPVGLCTTILIAQSTQLIWADWEWSADNYYEQGEMDTTTQSAFDVEIVEDVKPVAFEEVVEVDETMDMCDEPKIKQKGVAGKVVVTSEVVSYEGEEQWRSVVNKEVIEAVDEVVVKGGMKVYKTLQTSEGDVQYWCKLEKFRATAYDPQCLGCNETTAIGMKAGFGVIAVDPKVIKLRSKVYIPGYGMAVAGDTGGAIKGKRVDLGFDDIDASWGVRSVDVYLL